MCLSATAKYFARILSFFLLAAAVAALIPAFHVGALDPPQVEKVQSAYLYNIENDKVLFEHKTSQKIYPASTVKIMTALVAEERLSGRLDDTVTITAQMLSGVAGNNIGLKNGETILIRDLFYALLTRGANDAAHVLAFVSAGSINNFVSLMGERAVSLGALNTFYKNPSGMHDDDMYTTVADTAKIALAAYESALIMDMSSTAKYIIPPTNLSDQRPLFNRNYLIAKNEEIKYYLSNARGINAGSTPEAGHCVVSTAQSDGLTYLCIVMGGQSEGSDVHSYAAARMLFSWAFNGYGYVDVIDTSKLICEILVELSTEADYVTLVPKETLTVYLPLNIKPDTDLNYKWKVTYSKLSAPVYEGQEAGFVTIFYGDQMIGSVPLVTKNSVLRSDFLYAMNKIEEFSKSRFFKATLISGVCITIVYVFLKALYRGRKNKKRSRYLGK